MACVCCGSAAVLCTVLPRCSAALRAPFQAWLWCALLRVHVAALVAVAVSCCEEEPVGLVVLSAWECWSALSVGLLSLVWLM